MRDKLINAAAVGTLTLLGALALAQEAYGATPQSSLLPRGGKSVVPNAVVGRWIYGSVSPTTYWDQTTGVFAGNARGSAGVLDFNADGTYTEYVYLEMRTYGLTTTCWTVHSGTVAFDKKSFLLTPTKGHYKSESGSRKIDRDMTDDEMKKLSKTYAWRLEKDDSGAEKFVVPFEDGSKMEYKRQAEEKK